MVRQSSDRYTLLTGQTLSAWEHLEPDPERTFAVLFSPPRSRRSD